MTIIHIAELARLMLEYLEPAEAFVLGLLLGDTFPKMAKANLVPPEPHDFMVECMNVAVRANWSGGPAKILDRFVNFPQNALISSMCLAFEHKHVRIVMELHVANLRVCAHILREMIAYGAQWPVSKPYWNCDVDKMADAAVPAQMVPALVRILGRGCEDLLLHKAVMYDSLPTLDYLYSPGAPWHGCVHAEPAALLGACNLAAAGGQLPMLKRLVGLSRRVWARAGCSDGLTLGELEGIHRAATDRKNRLTGDWLASHMDARFGVGEGF